VGLAKWLLVVVWSFLCPGAGHALADQPRAALAWAAAGLVTVLAVPLTIWPWYVALAVRLGAAADVLVRIRRARVTRPAGNVLTGAPAIAFMVGLVYWSLFLQRFRIPSSAMYPTLLIGDQVIVELLTVQWSPPKRGDIIVFAQPCQPDRDYIKRVIAVANDTIEIRCNVVYVNGAAVPSELVEGSTCRYTDRDELQGESYERTCSRYRETLDGRSYEVFHDVERPERDEERQRTGGLMTGDMKDFPQLGDPLKNCLNVPSMEGESSPAQLPGRLVVTKQDAGACEPQLHFVVPPDSLFVLGDNRPNSNDSRYWGVVPVNHVRGRLIGRF
jgi:signal peptidase I